MRIFLNFVVSIVLPRHSLILRVGEVSHPAGYEIPRRTKAIDAIRLLGGVIFIVVGRLYFTAHNLEIAIPFFSVGVWLAFLTVFFDAKIVD